MHCYVLICKISTTYCALLYDEALNSHYEIVFLDFNVFVGIIRCFVTLFGEVFVLIILSSVPEHRVDCAFLYLPVTGSINAQCILICAQLLIFFT